VHLGIISIQDIGTCSGFMIRSCWSVIHLNRFGTLVRPRYCFDSRHLSTSVLFGFGTLVDVWGLVTPPSLSLLKDGNIFKT